MSETVKPYYNKNGITIFCGDCLEVMPRLKSSSFDLVATDPPYPELKGGTVYHHGGVAQPIVESVTIGTPWGAPLNWMKHAWRVARLGMMVFCSYHSVDTVKMELRENVVALVTWYKRNSPNPRNNVPKFTTEFVWLFKKVPGLQWCNLRTMYDIPLPVAGCFATERILRKDSKRAAHPTQKPKELMVELLKCNPANIIDPFMGTGTTLLAAFELGLPATGIELSEEYCRIAVERLRQPSFWSIREKQAPEKPRQVDLEEMLERGLE